MGKLIATGQKEKKTMPVAKTDKTTTEDKERDDQCMASLPRMESLSGIEVCQATESAHQILLQVGCFSYVSSQYMIQSVI